MRHRLLHRFAALLAITVTTPFAAAQDQSPADAGPPSGGTAHEPATAGGLAPPAPVVAQGEAATKTVACTCKAGPLPLYVEDWGRLADLAREDPTVFAQADFWRNRQENTHWLVAGILLGAGTAALGTADRLGSGEWSDSNKWMLVGGLTTALVSTLAYWAFSPDRDDLLTVVNHWNLRHPDRPLAP